MDLGWVDAVALAVLGVAALRGLWIGVVRESFSLAAIAAACLAVRFGSAPAGAWLLERAPLTLSATGARIAAGVVLALLALLVVGGIGRALRRGLHAVGLGLADRLAGGLLGAAEGGLVLALAVLLGVALLGRDHPWIESSRTVAAFESARELARATTPGPPDVAAPPPARGS